MVVNTKIFGEVDIPEERIIHLDNGIIGFPNLKSFSLMHNEERGKSGIAWLVSMEEPAFALPVMDPLIVYPTFNPEVEDELLKPLGELDPDDMLVLVTLSIPKGAPEKMTVNLKAPIIINAKERKAVQIILDGEEYKIKFPVYDILKKLKKEGE